MPREIFVGETKDVLNPCSVTFDERRRQLEKADEQEEIEAKREKQSPFSRWSQFNLERTRELMELTLKYPKAQAILFFLVDQMDEYNAVVCSYNVLQDVLGISRGTAARSVRVLKEKGFISILKSGSSNVYTINDTVYWKSWGNRLKYSKFPANVVLSETEQETVKTKFIKHKEVIVAE